MRFTLGLKSFISAIEAVAWATAKRTTKPSLEMVRLKASGDTLTVSATDLEVGASTQVAGVTIATEGELLVDPHRTLSLLKPESGGENVTVYSDAGSLRFDTGHGVLKAKIMDVAGSPTVEEIADLDGWPTLAAGDFRAAIRSVLFAADKEDSTARFATKGVLMDFVGDSVVFVTTDTRVMAANANSTLLGQTAKHSAIVPIFGCVGVDKLFGDPGESVRIGLVFDGDGKPREFFACGERSFLRSKLLEGRFPPYWDILKKPLKSKLSYEFDTDDFLRAVRQASAVTTDENLSASLSFHADGTVRLEANGEGEVDVEVGTGYKGGDVSIRLNPKYLSSVLSHVETPKVEALFVDALNPVAMKAGNSTFIIMPLGDK